MFKSMQRQAFTLVEMLVAIGILVVLATLAIAISPKLARSFRTADGPERVQEWLFLARSRAKGTQEAAGVRFIRDADGLVRSAVYIARPDDFTNGSGAYFDPSTLGLTAAYSERVWLYGFDLTGGLSDPDGDFIQIADGMQLFIKPEKYDAANNRSSVLLRSPQYALGAFGDNSKWRIRRGLKPVIGESLLSMPPNMVVDPALSVLPAGTSLDVTFARTGEQGLGTRVILWVREEVQPPDQPENQMLIVVFPSGRIGAFPVGPPSNPYQYAVDPRNSGL